MTRVSDVYFIADDALGIALGPEADRHAVTARLQQNDDWLDVIPGANSVSVQFDPLKLSSEEAIERASIALAQKGKTRKTNSQHWVIPTCYSPQFALDMEDVCARTGLDREAIINRHTTPTFTIDMMGFTPGFAYLSSEAFQLDMPRLDAPRQHVPAGSIGMARNQIGLYALDGPGGWPIIGRTSFKLFDPDTADPFKLNPGDSLRFEPISEEDFWTQAK